MKISNQKIKNIEIKYLNTWYNWLINYIPEPIRKVVVDFKDKAVSIFNTNTPKQTMYEKGKYQSKLKTKKI